MCLQTYEIHGDKKIESCIVSPVSTLCTAWKVGLTGFKKSKMIIFMIYSEQLDNIFRMSQRSKA